MAQGTGLTQSSIGSAAAVLTPPGPSKAGGGSVDLSILATPASAESWINAPLRMLESWVLQHFTPMADVLNTLNGDPPAITQHSTRLSALDTSVGQHAQTMRTARSQALTRWQGPAARAFGATADAMAGCDEAYAGMEGYVASAYAQLGETVATTKHAIAQMVDTMAPTVINRALMALAVGAPLYGASAAAGWASQQLDKASHLPVVGGLFGGASDAVEHIQAELQRALKRFCVWAASYIASYLDQAANLMQRLLATSSTALGEIAAAGDSMHRAASLLNGHGDPGPASTGLPDGSYGETVKGTQHQAQDTDLARIQAQFNNGGTPEGKPPHPYERVTDPDELAKLGLTKDMLRNDKDGFAAGVYVDPTSHPPKYVIPFGGTQDMTDWRENGIGGFTVSPQSKDAMAIANTVKNSPQHANVVYSGHSLGGRLATVASMTSGNGAVTYNAAGVSPATIDYIAARQGRSPQDVIAALNAGQVREYRTADDPLTWAQERDPGVQQGAPDASGAKIGLGGDYPILGAKGHGMDHVRDEMEHKYHD